MNVRKGNVYKVKKCFFSFFVEIMNREFEQSSFDSRCGGSHGNTRPVVKRASQSPR